MPRKKIPSKRARTAARKTKTTPKTKGSYKSLVKKVTAGVTGKTAIDAAAAAGKLGKLAGAAALGGAATLGGAAIRGAAKKTESERRRHLAYTVKQHDSMITAARKRAKAKKTKTSQAPQSSYSYKKNPLAKAAKKRKR